MDVGVSIYFVGNTEYEISGTILQKDDSTLMSDGTATLKLADNTDLHVIQNDDWTNGNNFLTVKGLKFDQNRDQQTFNDKCLIAFNRVNFSLVENNVFENVRYSSINFIQGGGMSYHNTVQNNIVRYTTNTGVAIQGSYNLIKGNTVYYCGAYAYYARQSVYGNLWIGNSAFYNDTQAGDGESLGMGIGEVGLLAYNQTIIGGEFAFLSRDGINIYNGAGSLLQGVNCHDNGRYGIIVGSSNITIVGAQVYNNGDWGIYVNHDGTSIIGANIHHNAKDGIRVNSLSNYTTIQGGYIWQNTEAGIEDYGWETLVSGTQITGNVGGYNQVEGAGRLSLVTNIIATDNGTENIRMRATGSYVAHSFNGTVYVSEQAGT